MVQSLEAVLTKLQKLYQIKSVELENLQKESDIKKIAFVITHLKEIEEISVFDMEKLRLFLTFIVPDMDLDNVALACSIVSATDNPAVKMGKRYLDALEMMKRIKEIAVEYVELQKDLPIKLANCEKSLGEMEDLFNVLANKVIVEDIDKYLEILNTELFPDDAHTVLTVVAAMVIRNATILENIDLLDKEKREVEEEIPEKVELNEFQQQLLAEAKQILGSTEERYTEQREATVTNLYLKNIESLIERKKISMDEAREMLRTGDTYEYFLWNWIDKLVNKGEKSYDQQAVTESFRQIETLLPKYKEFLSPDSIVDDKPEEIEEVTEEPIIEEEIIEEPVIEDSVEEEIIVEEPIIEEPVFEESVIEEPIMEEPVVFEEPGVEIFDMIEPEVVPLIFEEPTLEEPTLEEELERKEIIYNVSSTNEEDSFHFDMATEETIELVNQLKEGRDDYSASNINDVGYGLAVVFGETEYLLFKNMPENHTFILLNGKIADIELLNSEKLEEISSASILPAIEEMIIKNDLEYQQLTALTTRVEEIFVEKGLKSVE